MEMFGVISWFGALAFYQKVLVASTGLVSAWLAFTTGRGVLRRFHKRSRRPTCPPPKNLPDIDAFTKGGAGERRRSARRGGPAIEVLVADENDKENPRFGWVTDRSTNGLCLLLSEPVQKGTVLHILPNNATPTTPWSEVQVKNCRQNGTDWEVGCEWVQVPPWGVMLQFG